MDLSIVDVKARCEGGARLHLRHPVFGHLLFTGEGTDETGQRLEALDKDGAVTHDKRAKPVEVTVRGNEAPSVRKVVQKNNLTDMLSKNVGHIEKTGRSYAASLIMEFHNIEDENGEPLQADAAGIAKFLTACDDFIKQIVDFSNDQANFFKSASTF